MESEVNFRVLNKDILVLLPVIEEKTESGLIKPESMIAEEKKDRDLFFEVIGVGDNCDYVKIGNWIYPRALQYPQVLIDDTVYLVIHESNVLGIRKR